MNVFNELPPHFRCSYESVVVLLPAIEQLLTFCIVNLEEDNDRPLPSATRLPSPEAGLCGELGLELPA